MTWFRAVVKKLDSQSGTYARSLGLSVSRSLGLSVSRSLGLSQYARTHVLTTHPRYIHTGIATLFYRGTQEKEEGQLFDLIRDGQVAVKATRPGPDYVPKGGEILITEGVNIDECEGEPGNSETDEGSRDAGEGDEGEDAEDELSLSRRKRRLNARRVYDTYVDEELFDDVEDDMDAPLKTARRAKLGESKAEAVRELARAKKQKDASRREAERKKLQRGVDKLAEEDVRSKVRGYFEKSLQTPTTGLSTGSGKGGDPVEVAKAVERALYQAHGGEVTQGYKQKAGTLKFNLGRNEELRLHVLTGEIPPERLVEMDSAALASKELVEYRKKKEEESLKMSVLDTETAAKFSTAAALESAYSGYTGVKEQGSQQANVVTTKQKFNEQQQQHDREAHGKDTDEQPVDTQGSVQAVSSLNWKSIKSAQASKGGAANVISGIQGIDPGIGLDAGGGSGDGDEAYDPLDPPTAAPAVSVPDVKCDDKLRLMLMGNADPSSLGERVWEGTVSVAATGGSSMRASGLAGAGDLGELLGNDNLKFKERLSLSALGKFLEEVHVSRSKTVTVGVLSPCSGKPAATTVVDSSVLASFYRDRDRAGSVKRTPEIEIYIIPSGDLATRLVNTCWHTGNRQTVQACVGKPPLTLSPDQLVVVVTHPKGMVARPKPRDRSGGSCARAGGPAAPAAAAPAAAGGAAPALPMGLDLNAISNLAAAFGVADGVVRDPRPMNAPPAPPPAAAPAPVALDLGALNSLAAAFGVNTSPSPPKNTGAHRGGGRYDDRRR